MGAHIIKESVVYVLNLIHTYITEKMHNQVISAKKLYQSIYWGLYLGLCFISGWFVSGVLENYSSRKTGFSMDEEIAIKRPVITIDLWYWDPKKEIPEINHNIKIQYCPSYEVLKSPPGTSCQQLALGEKKFLYKDIGKTENVILEQIGNNPTFRIIPLTNLLEEKAKGIIKVFNLKPDKIKFDTQVFLTSLENSLGIPFHRFKDGSYLQFELEKNSFRKFLIQPEIYHLLPETSKCHDDESYYDCLTSELDKFDFNQTSCTTKCIPRMFSYGKNYSTPFCQNFKDDECAGSIFDDTINKIKNNFTKIVNFRCKHSCTILQYSGREFESSILESPSENHDIYQGIYHFENADNRMTVFSQYLIYDSMGMIGSVGGTFGMFIGFSMTGVISSIIEFFKERKIGRNNLV